MGFAAAVGNQCRLGVEPSGAFNTIVSTETGQILGGLGVFELGKMSRREQVCLDLVDIPEGPISLGAENAIRGACSNLVFRLVFVIVRLFPTPILAAVTIPE